MTVLDLFGSFFGGAVGGVLKYESAPTLRHFRHARSKRNSK